MNIKIGVILFILLFSTLGFTADEIRLESKPLSQITENVINCSSINLSNTKVYLVRKIPPGGDYNYISVIYFYDTNGIPVHYIARKDILNRYVFIRFYEGESIKSQFYGWDFVFNVWEDVSFYEIFQAKTCAELRSYHFIYGIYLSPNLIDFEGAAFTFN